MIAPVTFHETTPNLSLSLKEGVDSEKIKILVEKISECENGRIHFETTERELSAIFLGLSPLECVELLCKPSKNIPFHHIAALLRGIHTIFPTFTFPPRYQIMEKISCGLGYDFSVYPGVLENNEWLTSKLEEQGISNEETLKACLDLAYHVRHPHLYPVARTAVSVHQFSLNFLWVNLNPQDRDLDKAQHIFRKGEDEFENAECLKDPQVLSELEESTHYSKAPSASTDNSAYQEWKIERKKMKKIRKSFMYGLMEWAEANPGAQINLWYDSALVTERARQNTLEMLDAISTSKKVNLQLRDIRRLPNIPPEIRKSLHPGTHVYYRVDILKALIADFMMSLSTDYCVISDVDVKPMTRDALFDQRTINFLSSKGYVCHRVKKVDFENSFFIFNSQHPTVQKTHRRFLIEHMEEHIHSLRHKEFEPSDLSRNQIHVDDIFYAYGPFEENMGEGKNPLTDPRKIADCPPSQFKTPLFFPSDPRSEKWRLKGEDDIPYVTDGRSGIDTGEGQIQSLMGWKESPLPPVPPTQSRMTDFVVLHPCQHAVEVDKRIFSQKENFTGKYCPQDNCYHLVERTSLLGI